MGKGCLVYSEPLVWPTGRNWLKEIPIWHTVTAMNRLSLTLFKLKTISNTFYMSFQSKINHSCFNSGFYASFRYLHYWSTRVIPFVSFTLLVLEICSIRCLCTPALYCIKGYNGQANLSHPNLWYRVQTPSHCIVLNWTHLQKNS